MKRISIFGYGVTTKPLVELLNSQGFGCDIFDDNCASFVSEEKNRFYPSGEFDPQNSELEITSPGIPPYHPLITQAQNLRSEYDFFDELMQEKPLSIWVSGTNGKTTTTEMLEFLLKERGAKSGGNIGYPLTELYLKKPSIWVLETSSFMLHYTKHAYPKLYLLLPIREDHIHWHGGFDGYVRDKLSPLERMGEDTIALIPRELEGHALCKGARARVVYYEGSSGLAEELGLDIGGSVFREPFLLDSVLALASSKLLFGEADSAGLNEFRIDSHRIEEVRDSKGRLWVDDSKGTNVAATLEAIKSYGEKKIFLILGGDDKGANQEPIFELLSGLKVEVFLIGSNAERLESLARQYGVAHHRCEVLERAVREIKERLGLEEVALLSPAAASLDQFRSYKERGELFKKLALEAE